MASAVASNLPPAAAPAYGWLSPRVSFSRDAQGGDVMEPAAAMAAATPEPAISTDFIDFEFSLGGAATMLPADELFADGKLLPLRKAAAPPPDPEGAAAAALTPPARAEAAMPAPAEPVKPLRAAAVAAADGTDPYVFSPKAPSCSSRWRELLGLKRAAAAQSPTAKPSPSPAAAAETPASRAANSAAARSLKLLLQRNTGRASGASASDLALAPLLRDSSDSEASLSLASSRFSLSSSSSSSGHDHDDVPRLSLDSAADPNPPRIRLVRSSHHRHSTSGSTRAGRSPARRRPSPPPPPRCLSVDSPRMNSSGKIVFQGLERSSSSPCSFHAASKSRSRAVDRSYSSGVRVAPVVLNVPVCSRPVFGFFKDKKDSAAAKDASAAAAAARSRSALGRKAQGWSGELPRSSG
ncbi:flocculation protein FLO11-like [Panicum miliaceum]|uniref:Flocculation protein FLO11-like n=1 Tax=Panicum miliaceum TaxID=4540 RepID=A0A3L6S2P2_PANMI|nr:flocculation protein FLO11-like [Panicum miliaceum]